MFPDGLQDFRSFADDAAKEGFSLSSHRMSGGLYPDDPDYCVKPDPGLMTWGRMALAKDVGASDTTIEVTPEPGVTIPAQNVSSEFQALPRDVKRAGLGSWGVGSCSIGDEWVTCQRVRALPGDNWEIQVKRKAGGAAHPAGALVRGYLKGNVYYLPDPFSELYEEVDLTMLQFTSSCVTIYL